MPLSLDPIVCLAVACEPMGRLASESFDIPVPRAKRLSCDCVERPGNERLDLCIYPWWNSRCQAAILMFHGGSSGSSRHLNLLLRSRLVLYNRTRLGQGLRLLFHRPAPKRSHGAAKATARHQLRLAHTLRVEENTLTISAAVAPRMRFVPLVEY
jgi:hypothetical protein